MGGVGVEEKDGTLDILINSLRYPFTNIGSSILGGFVFLFSFILVGIPFLLGYWVRIGREILKQNETLPAWNNLEELFSDGIRAFIIGILYGIVLIIIEIVYTAAIVVVDLGLPNPVNVFIRIFYI